MGHRAKRRRVVEPDLATDALWEDRSGNSWYEPLSEALSAMDTITRRLGRAQRAESNVKDTRPLLIRRQAAATTTMTTTTTDLTVVVEDTVTVGVEVDGSSLPTMTISLPSAPSTPSFPSDLTVPALPAAATATLPAAPSAPQIVTTVVEVASAAGSLTQAYLSPPVTPLPESTETNNGTSAPTNIATSISTYATLSAPSNSTILTSVNPVGTGTPSNLLAASNSSANATSGLPTTLYSNSSLFVGMTASSLSTLSTVSGSSQSSAATSTSGVGAASGAGSGYGGTGHVPPGSGSYGNGNGNGGGSGGNGMPRPGIVAGAVTGSVGGTAVLLLILILFVRWLRHRNSSPLSALAEDESLTRLRPATSSTSQGPSMVQGSILPVAAVGALTRLSVMGGQHRLKSSPTLPPPERGFQKLSGRKMPSQFGSEMDQGPMSMDFAAAAAGRPQRDTQETSLSDVSFILDTQDFYGGQGGSPERPAGPLAGGFGGPLSAAQTEPRPETMRPSPARTPVIQSAEWAITPPVTAGTSTLGRSFRDGSHSSRFTEQM